MRHLGVLPHTIKVRPPSLKDSDMNPLREMHVGLTTVNGGRFASPHHGEGVSLETQRSETKPLQTRYDLDDDALDTLQVLVAAGADRLEIAQAIGTSEPAADDMIEYLSGQDQVRGSDDVSLELVQALKDAGVNRCYVERMKRGKTNILVRGGIKFEVKLDASGHPEYTVGGNVIQSEGPDDHEAWLTALFQAVDKEAVDRNIKPLVGQGSVSLEVSMHDGGAKGQWKHEGHEVKFEVNPNGNVVFDPMMSAAAGVQLQEDLGVKSLEEVTPSISRFRAGISRAHRWALWHPSMDAHRYDARPGLKSSYEYDRLKGELVRELQKVRGAYTESQNGIILQVSGPGYDAEVLVPVAGEPAYYINGRQVYGLDDTKTNQRELAKFLRSSLDSLRLLEVGRRNGLAAR